MGRRIPTCIGFVFFLAGCQAKFLAYAPKDETVRIDALKRIVYDRRWDDVDDNPSDYGQQSYAVTDHDRLLLRVEELPEWYLTSKHSIHFSIHCKSSTCYDGAYLKLCPLTENWMMLASWNRPHPYSSSFWSGGHFEESRCIHPTVTPATTESDGNSELRFDITKWIRDYDSKLDKNYGWILMQDSAKPEVWVAGDASSLYGPRLLYRYNYDDERYQ